MFLRIVPVLAFCIVSSSASTQESASTSGLTNVDFSECVQYHDDQVRLDCYDQKASYQPSAFELSNDGSGWVFFEEKDAFSGKNTSFVALESDPQSRIGEDPPNSLFVRCNGRGGSEIFVVADGYIGARRDSVPVRYKFDDERPISENWNESTKGTAAFLPSRYQEFRSGLVRHDTVLFEITDFRGSPNHARFVGLKNNLEALNYVISGCE